MPKTVVILPCHAIYKGVGDGTDPKDWYMVLFQYEGNDHLAWIKQLQVCISILCQDKEAVLIITGGKTKPVALILESFSYLNLVLQNKKMFGLDSSTKNDETFETLPSFNAEKYLKNLNLTFGSSESKIAANDDLFKRIYLEEYARDSFENVKFSLERAKEISRANNENSQEEESLLPERIVIVGYEFKRARFTKLHIPELGYKGQVDYIGIDPIPSYDKTSKEYTAFYENVKKQEYENAYKLFKETPRGDTGRLLSKKKTRNPFKVEVPSQWL